MASSTEDNRSTTDVVHDHLVKRLAGEVEADIGTNFSKDVIIISNYGVYRGHDGVRESADMLDEAISNARFEYGLTMIEGECALLEWSAEAEDKSIESGVDSFVVRDGKIIAQTIFYKVKSD